MRPSWIEIDLDAIEHNASVIAAHIAPASLCAVVKADAYGHGDVPTSEAAVRGGAEYLAVALVEEGVRLREAEIDVPILVLSEPQIEDAGVLVSHALTPTVYRTEFVEALAASATVSNTIPYPVHLKLDTGMHRVGAPPVEAFELARHIDADPRLVLQGVFTHFAVADSDAAFTGAQNSQFRDFVSALAEDGIEPRLIHAANTAAAFDATDTRYDLCRVGLGIYGMRPHPMSGVDLDLRPAMRVVGHVAYVRRHPAGSSPSYGRTRTLSDEATVVTVAIGYADGVPRSLTKVGSALIRGKRYPFAGTVTMDMVMIDVGDDQVDVGDEVVFMGTQDGGSIPAEEWADHLDTINYEVVCDFGPRLPRRYVRGATNA
jgi:alanine racemase